MTQTSVDKVLQLIKENPKITRIKIAKAIGKSEVTVKRYIEILKAENKIKRVGSSTFGGHWEVIG